MSLLEAARQSFATQRWAAAVEHYEQVIPVEGDLADDVTVDDTEYLAVAAYLTGNDELCAAAFERAHRAHLAGGDIDNAVRCGFWLGFTSMMRGDMAQASGWLARAGRLVEEHDPAGSGRGYLLIPATLRALDSGDADTALSHAQKAREVARSSDDLNLGAFATLAIGQCLLNKGDADEGRKYFDEVMISVTSGEVSHIISGVVYCAVIDECVRLLDVRRAAEWTDALDKWCAQQPDLVPYRGQCLVHRSQMLQLHGSWPEAEAEADQARVRLTDPPHPALGLACYQRGELHRLRGEFAEAQAAYKAANEHGLEPMPGLPLLRLAEGNLDAASAAIKRAIGESLGRSAPTVLAAAVQILGAVEDLDGAKAASDELSAMAAACDVTLIEAMAAHGQAVVARLAGDPSMALKYLRSALELWRQLEMPYEAAHTREQIGLACHEVGDVDGCALEIDSARATYESLGAAPDLARLVRLDPTAAEQESGVPAGLTGREVEVLSLVAGGKTNRAIGSDLVISEHTVARHVQNIFSKLGVSSRAAATAYAYEHDLI